MTTITLKTCTKCKIEQATSYFYREKRNKDGLRGVCKNCMNGKRRSNYKEDSSRILTQQAVYRKIDKHQTRMKNWRESNKEHLKEYNKKWNEENREHVQKYRKQYVEENYEFVRALQRDWYENNKDHVLAYNRMRRALKYAVTIGPIPSNIREILVEEQGSMCGICLDDIIGEITGKKVHVDHVYPLSKGGFHMKENLQAAHATCNLQKYNKVWDRESGVYK